MAASFRLAVAQSPADLDGTDARLAWLDGQLPEIVGCGASLVLLPELFACGYNIGAQVQERAEPAQGPTQVRIVQMAKAHGIAIHYGFAEREGETVYNAAQCIGPDGTALSLQRKLAIPPGFEGGQFTAGRGCHVFDYGGLKIATLICYDAEFPETARHVAAQGAALILVPTALGAQWGWVAHSMIPARAYENGVYLAYANSAGREQDMAFLGRSFIAAPDGVELARAGSAPEVIYADIEPARASAAQARLPYLRDRAVLKLE